MTGNTVVSINDARSPLNYALRYIALGWHVLPLDPGTKKPLGKVVRNGFHDATNDPAIATSWWSNHPDAGIGVALRKSGLVAVDIDPRNGGLDTMETIEGERGPLLSDVLALTGGGGEHRVFASGLVENLPGSLGRGVDLKADGYIAVEPTIHPSGTRYAWDSESDPLDGIIPTTLPSWIRGLVRGETAALPPTKAAPAATVDPLRRASAVEALQHLDASNYDTWIHVGMAFNQEMPGQDGFDEWATWSATSPKFDAQAQMQKWRSFTRRPLGERRQDFSSVFAEAARRGWKNDGGAKHAASAHPITTPTACLPLVFAETIEYDGINIGQIVEDVLTQGGLSVMYGESNSGKSFLACDMSCAMGAGTEWLGKRTVRGAVLYVAGEGSQSIKMRVLAWRQERRRDPWVAVVPEAVNLLDPKADIQRIVDATATVATHYGCPVALIVIDTLARAFAGGNENASEDMSAVISNADAIRAATNAHVMFVHHSGKDSAKGSRGHSSLKAATDTEIEVTGEEETHLHTAEIKKQRDLPTRGEKITGKFLSIRMGTDQWGKDVTTCVVNPTEDKPSIKRPSVNTKAKHAELRQAIIAALSSSHLYDMKRSQLVTLISKAGFSTASIYNAINEMVVDGRADLTSMGVVHLNNGGAR